MSDKVELCHVDDIPDGSGKNLYHKGWKLIAIRQGEQVFVYENACPHLNIPLEWRTDHFLSTDQSLIQCSTHGALFTIGNGECISGPCHGHHLRSIPSSIINNTIAVVLP